MLWFGQSKRLDRIEAILLRMVQNDDDIPRNPLKKAKEKLDRLELSHLYERIEGMERRYGPDNGGDAKEQAPTALGAEGLGGVKEIWDGIPALFKPALNGVVKAKLGFSVEDALGDEAKLGQVFELIRPMIQPWLEKLGGAIGGGQPQKKQLPPGIDVHDPRPVNINQLYESINQPPP
jgi:hypothetical protein